MKKILLTSLLAICALGLFYIPSYYTSNPVVMPLLLLLYSGLTVYAAVMLGDRLKNFSKKVL